MRKGVGEGNSKIWDLKYKISEDLEIKLKKCNNNFPIHNQRETIAKDGDRTWVFKSGKMNVRWPFTRKLVCVSWRGKNSKSVEWKQVVAREKTKFKMKIMRGKKQENGLREVRGKICELK